MSASADETDQQIVDGVLPPTVDTPAVPVSLNELPPWHRPRKQLVREEQWIYFSRRLVKHEKGRPTLAEVADGDPEVRYLTLPGIDYLDVRLLAGMCRDLNCRLTSTGFQSGGEDNSYVARAQLREKSLIDAGHITSRSHTFARRFEDITHTSGQAYRDLRRRGPFHIVNIDACGSIARPRAGHANRLIDALHRILELQFELMTGRWLLFVTADVRPDSIAQQTLDRLCDAIFANAAENEDFRNLATPLLNPQEIDIRAAVKTASARAGTAFLQLFSLGLAKWLLDLAKGKSWDMKTHHPYCYSTMPAGDDTPSMACLAFEFFPPPAGLQDRFGISRATPVPNAPLENTSIRAANKIRGMANADCRITADKTLRTRMTENLRRELEDAGYEPAALEDLGPRASRSRAKD